MATKKKTSAKKESKELTPEEILEQLTAAKQELKEARTPVKKIRMKHKCMKSGSVPKDKKVATELKKLEKVVEACVAKRDELQEAYDAVKPKKAAGERNTKYEYPEGLSDAEKKKFRAKMRREAKAAEGGEEKTSKKSSKKKDEAKEEKSSKKKGGKKKVSKDQEEAHDAAKKVTKKKGKKGKKETEEEDD